MRKELIIGILIFSGIFLTANVRADCVNGVTEGNNISQYGITWFFDKEYQCGQFVNGDYWVKTDEISGVVNVVDINPRPENGRNGSMVNPLVGSQCFDSRGFAYNLSTCPDLSQPISSGSSLISSISLGEPNVYGQVVKTAAVLTVLGEVPPVNAFRPPYSGKDKTLYLEKKSTIDLPNLGLVSSAPYLADVESLVKRPWIELTVGVRAKETMPVENMEDYGRNIMVDEGKAGAFLLLDETQVGDKKMLMRYLAQIGIDNYGLLKNGKTWWPEAGIYSGRKFPIVFAGFVTEDSNLLNIGKDYLPETNTFQEDGQTYYVKKYDVDYRHCYEINGFAKAVSTNTIQFYTGVSDEVGGFCDSGKELPSYLLNQYIEIVQGPGVGQKKLIVDYYVNMSSSLFNATVDSVWNPELVADETKYQIINFEDKHIGMPFWSSKHTYEPWWDQVAWTTGYNTCCGATGNYGVVIAAKALGLVDEWNHNPFFDYQDRYYEVTKPGGEYPSFHYWDKFAYDVYVKYRNDYECTYIGINEIDHSRIYNCSSVIFDCKNVDSCNEYPNSRALDYDPCGLGCESEPPQQCTLTSARWEIG